MDKNKQPSQQEKETAITQSKFWGAIALGTLVVLVDAYLLSALFQALGTLVNYIAIGVFALILAPTIVSIILIIRGRQELGTKLVFYAAWGIGISASALYQGRTLNASLSILFITVTAILGLFPKESRLRFFGISGVAFILMWIFEWINPPWRSQVATATVGPAVAIVFLLVFVAMAVRQAWGGNIRVKLVTSFTVIALISVAIVGTVVYISYRNQVRKDIRQRLCRWPRRRGALRRQGGRPRYVALGCSALSHRSAPTGSGASVPPPDRARCRSG